MRTFPSKIISTLLGTVLLSTSSLMWADETIDEAFGVIPEACQDVRANYKDDKKAINQSCFEKRDARDQALADCNGFWNYCKTPCDQTPPVSGKIKVGGYEAWDNLCTAKQELEDCRAQRTADLEVFQQEVNEICCPFWPCRPICSSIVGTWTIFVDVGCNGSGVSASATYHDNLTWNIAGFANHGTWSQQDCEVEKIDMSLTPSVVWTGKLKNNGSSLSGTFTNGAGLNGCWTLAHSSSAPAAIAIPPASGSLYGE
jgi:hypothetical protein